MIQLVQFRTEEAVEDSFAVFINPALVTALMEEGDGFTRIYTTNSEESFVVYGEPHLVASQLNGTAERNREAYG